jgi:hypothetical protein
MRKVILLIPLFALLLVMGCSYGVGPQVGTMGWVYTDYHGPVTVTDSDAGFTKVGVSTYSNVLGIVATGDGSISAAMKDGGITRVHHIDYKNYTILGVYHKMTVYVYGE